MLLFLSLFLGTFCYASQDSDCFLESNDDLVLESLEVEVETDDAGEIIEIPSLKVPQNIITKN